MYNLKTILTTSPQARREYRRQVRDYNRQQALIKQQEAEFNKNLQYASSSAVAQYNKLKSEYDKAFKKQGEALAEAYATETKKALTKQAEDFANYYKEQETLKKLEAQSQQAKAISDKLNILGTNIIDEINANKARAELAKAKKSSSSRRRTSVSKGTSYRKYQKETPLTKSLSKNTKSSKTSSTRTVLDDILGR